MVTRTVESFVAYKSDGAGQGVPLIATGAPGELVQAASDGRPTPAGVTALHIETGEPYALASNIHGVVEGFTVDVPETCPGVWFTSGPVRSYRRFMEGRRGLPGLPGPNAIPADEAVGVLLASTGTATNSEATSLIGSVLMAQLPARAQDTEGAFYRILQREYGGVVNARSLGATGTGATDDTDALNAVFAAHGGTIVIPPGDYKTTSTLVIPNEGTTVIAYGARIFRASVFSFVSNIPKTDGTTPGYDGPGNLTVLGGLWDAQGHTHNSNIANSFTWAHCRNITMRDCVFLDTAGAHAVEFDGVDGGLLENCDFRGYLDTGSRGFSECVQIDTATGGRGAPDNTLCRNIRVTGGKTGPSANLGPWPRFVGSHSCYVDNGAHEHIRVDHNTVEEVTSIAIRPYGWSHFRIEKNDILKNGSTDAIQVMSPTTGTGGHQTNMINGRIAHNNILDSGDDGIVLENRSGRSMTDMVVFDNAIGKAVFRGIYVSGAVTDPTIRANRITNVGNVPITLNGCTNAVIDQNRCRKGTGTVAKALSIIAGTTGTWHSGNDFRGYGATAVGDSGTGTLAGLANIT